MRVTLLLAALVLAGARHGVLEAQCERQEPAHVRRGSVPAPAAAPHAGGLPPPLRRVAPVGHKILPINTIRSHNAGFA